MSQDDATVEQLRERLARERAAHREAEAIADSATRDLHETIEELKRANEALALAHEIRGEILSIAWHEVRTPLTVLRGFAELLATRWDGLPEQERQRYAAAIAQKAHVLALRLDELSWTSQLHRGDVDVGAVRVHVGTVVGEAQEAVPELTRAEVSVECPDDVFVFTDPRHARTILRMFLANAVVHGKPPIDVRVTATDGGVEIRVCDAGAGIETSALEELFRSFTQVDRSMTRERGGAGLGLALARGLADASGAEVWYEDAPGGGACFVLWLPESRPSVA